MLLSIHEAIPLLVINEFQAHALGIVSAASKTMIPLQLDVTSVVALAMRLLVHSQNSILQPFRKVTLPRDKAVGIDRRPIGSVLTTGIWPLAAGHCLLFAE